MTYLALRYLRSLVVRLEDSDFRPATAEGGREVMVISLGQTCDSLSVLRLIS